MKIQKFQTINMGSLKANEVKQYQKIWYNFMMAYLYLELINEN